MEKAKNIEPFAVKKEEKSRTPSPPPPPQISEDRSPQTPSPPRISSSSNNSRSQINSDEFDIPTISEIATSASSQQLHTKELSQLQELQNRIYQTKNKQQTPSSEEDKEEEEQAETATKPTENSKPSTIIRLSEIRKTENEIAKNSLKSFIQKQKADNDRREAKRGRDARERIEYRSSDRNRRDRRSRSISPISRDNRYRPKRRSRSRSPIERKPRPSIHERIGGYSKVSSRKRSKSPEAEKRENLKVKRPTLSSTIIKAQPGRAFLRALTEAHKSTTMKPEANRHQNLVIRVNSRNNDDEYVPQSISSHSESESTVHYHPSKNRKTVRTQPAAAANDDDDNVVCLNNNDVDLDDLEGDSEQPPPRKSPQFIVSLEGIDSSRFDDNTKSSKSPTPPPVIKRNKRSVKERIGLRSIDQLLEEPRAAKLRAPMEVVEDDEDVECESQRAYNKIKRSKVSPIKFDLTDEENEDDGKSRGSSIDHSPKKSSKKRSDENGEEQKRIRLETTRSFDHVPACKKQCWKLI